MRGQEVGFVEVDVWVAEGGEGEGGGWREGGIGGGGGAIGGSVGGAGAGCDM